MTAELLENTPSGVYLLAAKAISGSSVVYKIINGNQLGFFTMDPHSGVLITNVVFDYELHSFFNLTVTASNIVNAQTTLTVLIHVTDENDNSPQFSESLFNGHISEGSGVGSIVFSSDVPLVVRATDIDSGLNSLLTYSIVEKESQEFFSVDSNTGTVRTHAILDREQYSQHIFHVQVSDLGDPQLSCSEPARVVISIDDTNDSPPFFEQDTYIVQLALPTYESVIVAEVQASDPDLNQVLTYSLVENDGDSQHFEINSTTGVIRVLEVKLLNDDCELVVKVSDGLHQTEMTVHIETYRINVIEQLDSLRFSQESYYVHLMENSSKAEQDLIGLQIVGKSLGEPVSYRIINPCDKFMIEETSGVIKTTKNSFDREEEENYTIIVSVHDMRVPRRETQTLVHVRILDSNDNAPLFLQLPYHAVVFVDAEVGEHIKQVRYYDNS